MKMAHYLPIQMDNKTPLVDLAARSMECHLHLVLLALQAFGSTPCQPVLPNGQTALDQMLTLVVALSYLRVLVG